MAGPVFDDDDYTQAMANLLPRGRAWPRDPDAFLMALLRSLAPTYSRSGAAAAGLIDDVFPATTNSFLTEWEESLGLPDPCTVLGATVTQRRNSVLAKLVGNPGQTEAYFIAVAAALGFTITITEGAAGTHQWTIHASLNNIVYFKAGISVAGDPLASWGNSELECRLNMLKPAHTQLLFAYT
jgi:uncharacterized protein YmfQ (DUF2313 family)